MRDCVARARVLPSGRGHSPPAGPLASRLLGYGARPSVRRERRGPVRGAGRGEASGGVFGGSGAVLCLLDVFAVSRLLACPRGRYFSRCGGEKKEEEEGGWQGPEVTCFCRWKAFVVTLVSAELQPASFLPLLGLSVRLLVYVPKDSNNSVGSLGKMVVTVTGASSYMHPCWS